MNNIGNTSAPLYGKVAKAVTDFCLLICFLATRELRCLIVKVMNIHKDGYLCFLIGFMHAEQ